MSPPEFCRRKSFAGGVKRTYFNGINPTEHSNPAIFFETKGNSRDNSLGQKSNGYLTKQNYHGLKSILYGLASGEVFTTEEDRWYDIPAYDAVGYFTDYD